MRFLAATGTAPAVVLALLPAVPSGGAGDGAPSQPLEPAHGALSIRLSELPADAHPAAMLQRLAPGGGPVPADRTVELATESYFVYVPESYAPERPHGLLVWVSPTDDGAVRRPELRAELAARRLIWIAAERSGNERAGLDRHALALAAAAAAPRRWSIDPERVFVGGYSGGGRVASQLALLWPERFRGGLFVMGCNWYAPLAVPGEPGRRWRPSFPAPDRGQRRLLLRHRRFAFVTAEGDFNRDQTRATEAAARRDGFRRTIYLEAPGGDHVTPLPIDIWRRALAALDGER